MGFSSRELPIDELDEDDLMDLEDAPVAVPRLKPSAIAMLIIQECKLADDWMSSVCLCCKKRVMAQSTENTPPLYCQALNRDIAVPISRCTSFTQD